MREQANNVEVLYKAWAQHRVHTQGEPDVITQYNFLNTWLKAHAKTERGAAMVEYALLVALIAVVCIAAVTFLGREAADNFSSIGNSIN